MPTENQVAGVIAQRIRLRRKALGMTQAELGEKIGVTYQQIQKYERGSNHVTADRLWLIAQVLDVSLAYFFEGLEDLEYVPSEWLLETLGRSEIADCLSELAHLDPEDIKGIMTPLAARLRSQS